MNYVKFLSPFSGLLILMAANSASAQSDMMMDGCMMMSGWMMLVWIALGLLLFVALVLAILALLKYLSGKK